MIIQWLNRRRSETIMFIGQSILTPEKKTLNHTVDMSKSPNKPRLPLSHRFCARNAAEKDLWLRAVSNVKALRLVFYSAWSGFLMKTRETKDSLEKSWCNWDNQMETQCNEDVSKMSIGPSVLLCFSQVLPGEADVWSTRSHHWGCEKQAKSVNHCAQFLLKNLCTTFWCMPSCRALNRRRFGCFGSQFRRE